VRVLAWSLSVLAVALAAGGTSVAADDPAADPAPRDWAYSLLANAYIFPGDAEDEEDFLLGVAAADRGALHLEARWNYEALDTGSLWAGWNWSTGETVELELTPMLGAVLGETDGVAPGLELSLAWRRLDYYLESEAVFDLDDRDESFVYGWSELAVSPVDWLRVGIVAQRTRVYQTERDVQRGVLAQFVLGVTTVGAYWFNPGEDDSFTVAVVQLDF